MQTPVLTINEDATVEDRLTANAQHNILPARYLRKDDSGNVIESPAELFERVAQNVAEAENELETNREVDAVRDKFESAMKELRFMPNSPTLMNAGTPLNQLSACFLLEPKDDMADIKETDKDAAMIFKSGGGVGYAFHHLRPKGAYISTTGGHSSGPVSFMRLFDETCQQVQQGGKRRGAQMGIMRVDHPDVGRFIVAKREEGELDNFNISVGVTDDFLDAVDAGETFTFGDPETDFEEPFEGVEQTVQFYDPRFEDNPASAFDDGEGSVVDENLWRDHADGIEVRQGGETVSLREKWHDEIELAEGEAIELPAEFIWDIMVDGAHRNGEPGLFYYDEANRDHTFPEGETEYDIEATNPCLTGDTLVNTPDGLVRAEDVSEGDLVSTIYGSETVDEILEYENQAVYQVKLSDGGSIKATEDHRFHVSDGKKWVDKNRPLRDISEGDKIRLEPSSLELEGTDEDYKYQLRRGILTGDGGYTQATIDNNNRLSISSSEDDSEFNQNVRELFEDAGYDVGELDTAGRNKSVKLWIGEAKRLLDEHNLEPAKSHEKSVDVTEFETQLGVQGFLDGLLATDGSVSMSSNRPQIRWATSSEKLAENIRNLALNIGMHARIYEDERSNRGGTRSDGSEIGNNDTHTLYNVHIAGESADTFVRNTRTGDYHTEKGERIETLRNEFMLTGGLWQATVDSIELCEERKTVFDLYCSDSDTWITEGYVNRGCAEQPLAEYEACNLGHVNLSLMVSEGAQTWEEYSPHTDSLPLQAREYAAHALDMEQLAETVSTGVHFLDNVVTQSDFPLDDIERRVDELRKIGLGIMGLAQMLYQLGIPYDSAEGREVAAAVMEMVDSMAVQKSHELATERGTFPAWEESKYAAPTEHSDWFFRHVREEPGEWDDGYTMRNHNVTTIAPTGTTSMIGDTSGGCEPVYSVAYYKNVGGDIQGDDLLVEFDSYFIRTLEANDIDVEAVKREAQEQMEADEWNGVRGLDAVPDELADVFVTTEQIAPEDHTLMQRRLQEFVDSGISKTINLPADATRAGVDDAYRLALSREHKGAPAKGLTVYRDGSRDEQVKSTTKEMGVGEDDIDGLEEKLVELYQSDELTDGAVTELVQEHDLDLGDKMSADICPECQDEVLERQEGCALCPNCGHSPCA